MSCAWQVDVRCRYQGLSLRNMTCSVVTCRHLRCLVSSGHRRSHGLSGGSKAVSWDNAVTAEGPASCSLGHPWVLSAQELYSLK